MVRSHTLFNLIPLVMLLLGCTLQPTTDPRRPDPENEPTMVPTTIAVEKPTYEVQQGTVSAHFTKSGRITPVEQTGLGFAISGQLEQLHVSAGEEIQAGDIVATLDISSLEAALQEAETDLRLVQEQLTIAEEDRANDLRRAEIAVELAQLALDFAIEQAEEGGEAPTSSERFAIEVKTRELELAQLTLTEFDRSIDPLLPNQVAQVTRQMEKIEAEIGRSTLIAPVSGTVMIVNKGVGDLITEGEVVLVIADLSTVEAEISLLDREVQLLTEGLRASGTLASRPESTIEMRVRQLPYPYGSGAEDEGSDPYVRLTFDNPAAAEGITIGERIEVVILLEERENALWLPPAAIREFNGRLFVVVQEGEIQKRIDIKIGLQNENRVEILSGLAAGERVIGP